MASEIRRNDGKYGPLTGIFDDLEKHCDNAVRAGTMRCAYLTQEEVVGRCPTETGNLKDCFSSSDAVGKDEKGKWTFGLRTAELAQRGHYWRWVEFGSKGRPIRAPRSGRRRGRIIGIGKPHPAHPFFRPGVAAARQKWMALMMIQMSIALQIMGLRADKSGSALGEYSETASYGIGLQIAIEMDRRAREDED
jgi:hypothetical protein